MVDATIHKINLARMERRSDDGLMGMVDPDRVIAFRPRVVDLPEDRRERMRILAPGATGSQGTPYKLLRTQVLRRLTSINANSLAVLSAGSGEGKTLTAINLAIAIAADLNRTALLVDLDLRNPSIHRRLGITPEIGIEDCLQQRRPVSEALIKLAGYDRLTVLPARGRVEQSSEMISAQAMSELMQELRTRYVNRLLIIDLPPVLQADDVLAFSSHVEAGLFVVSEGKTERAALTRSLTLLDKLPIIGSVLNASREDLNNGY